MTADGADFTLRDLGERDPIARAAALLVDLLAASLTTTQVAEKLGVASSRIPQRLSDRTIYGIRSGGRWRLPAFQFDGKRLVPSIGKVLPNLHPELPTVVVYRWFPLPNVDPYAKTSIGT